MDHDPMSDEDAEIDSLYVTLTDEDGDERTFRLVQTVKLDSKSYAVLVEAEEDESDAVTNGDSDHGAESDDDILILRISTDGDDEYFEEIEDDSEFQKVVSHLESLARAEEVKLGAATVYK